MNFLHVKTFLISICVSSALFAATQGDIAEKGSVKSAGEKNIVHSIVGDGATGISTNSKHILYSGAVYRPGVGNYSFNDAPEFITPDTVSAPAGEPFSLVLLAVDPEGKKLIYNTLENLPTGYILKGDTLTHEELPKDTLTVSLIAFDGSLADTLALTISPEQQEAIEVNQNGKKSYLNFTAFPKPAKHGSTSRLHLQSDIRALAEEANSNGGVVLLFSSDLVHAGTGRIEASFAIFDMVGNKVFSVENLEEDVKDGTNLGILWDGKNNNGYPVSPGAYVALLSWRSGDSSGTHKTVISIKKDK